MNKNLLIGALTIVVIMLGGYVMSESKVNKISVPQQTQNEITPIENISVEKANIDWQTYSQDKIVVSKQITQKFPSVKISGISFQYPKSWKVYSSHGTNDQTYLDGYDNPSEMSVSLAKTGGDNNIGCGEGPCDNTAYISFWFGVVPTTYPDWERFWMKGIGYPQLNDEQQKINNIPVDLYYYDHVAIPAMVIFHLSPTTQAMLQIDSYGNGEDPIFDKMTPQEIDAIIHSIKFK